jgi:hypothetical protein
MTGGAVDAVAWARALGAPRQMIAAQAARIDSSRRLSRLKTRECIGCSFRAVGRASRRLVVERQRLRRGVLLAGAGGVSILAVG